MMKRDYNQVLARKIDQFLTDDDWKYTFDEDIGLFRFTFSINSKLKQLLYDIKVNDDEYMVYANCSVGPEKDDKELMTKLAEFFCRANYGLRIGCFEMDMNDGEIRYKVCVDCDGDSEPTEEIIKNSIIVPAYMFDRYGNGMLEVIFAGKDPEQAVKDAESDLKEDTNDSDGASEDGPDEDVESMIARLTEQFGIVGDDNDSEDQYYSDN